MTEPSLDERPHGTAHEHPPFRMRGHRRRLLPDLSLPTLDELQWAVRQRRLRREPVIAQPSRALHVLAEPGQEAAVFAPVETLVAEPPAPPVVIELPDVAAPDLEAYLAPAPELDLEPDIVELVPEPVVREVPPSEPHEVAVFDATPANVATVTQTLPAAAERVDEEDFVGETDYIAPAVPSEVDGRPAPLYWRLLRLRYTRPNGWLRALFFEGAVAVAVVLVLAEVASVWTIVVLPFVVAVVVKANDILAGSLQRSYQSPRRH